MKILIVEDDTPVAFMMVYLLTCAGCETEVATTGKKAMQMAETGNFDLITLDVDLPGINGFELIATPKANPPLGRNARCICVSRCHHRKSATRP